MFEMDKKINVSVIIPTYGQPQFLDKAICSVVSQSLKTWELIIVDDNDPNTEARLQTETLVSQWAEKDSRIAYIKHECNKNGAVARNTGFAVAQGKYISLLDSDDEYMPERLQRCYEKMESCKDERVAGVYTGCEFRRKGKTYNRYTQVKDGNFLVQTLACNFMFCTGSNIFVRKDVVDELNGFDGNFLRHQDYEFLVRIFEKYSLFAIPELLVIKNNENFNLPDVEKQILIKKQYLEKFKSLIDTLPEEERIYIYHTNFVGIAENAMAQRKYKIARQYYKTAISFGHLTHREILRYMAYPVYNLIKR